MISCFYITGIYLLAFPALSLSTYRYEDRSRQIQSESGLVEHALELLRLGMAQNVPISYELFHQFSTLFTLTVEHQHSSASASHDNNSMKTSKMSLSKLEKLSEADVLGLSLIHI